ncbi:MAG: C-terminal helicase domain-containing protein [Saprospiraceae bacterium]
MPKSIPYAENVAHQYYMVNARDRYEVLKRIADLDPNIYGIVFCRTRRETKEVANKFMHDGYNADALHGDLSQAQRDEVMGRFRSRKLQMLVATDVAARGLDVDDLTHVINFDLPDDDEVYIHRSGRTGRAGKVVFLSPSSTLAKPENYAILNISREYPLNINWYLPEEIFVLLNCMP